VAIIVSIASVFHNLLRTFTKSVIYFLFLLLLWCFGQFSGHGLPDLLPPTFFYPCCRLPAPYLEQICGISQDNNLQSASKTFPTDLLPPKHGILPVLFEDRGSTVLATCPADCSVFKRKNVGSAKSLHKCGYAHSDTVLSVVNIARRYLIRKKYNKAGKVRVT